jgi:hypothetical protein
VLSRAPPCFGRHLKPLVPAVHAQKGFTSGRKNYIAESLSQHDEKTCSADYTYRNKRKKLIKFYFLQNSRLQNRMLFVLL